MLTDRWSKGYKANTVEAQQSRMRPNPYVSVGCLGYRIGFSREGAVAQAPGSVGVLRNPPVRIKSVRTGKRYEQ
jgi:hypothetical protein